MTEPTGALMAVHSLLSGKLDVVLEGDQTRAALAGDQPKAEEPLAWCSGCGLEVGTNRYLNRCGSCGEELQAREVGPKRGADYASVRVCGDEVYNHSYVDTAEGLSGEDLRAVEERDDAAGDLP